MYQNWLICISVMNWRCTKIGTLTFKGLIMADIETKVLENSSTYMQLERNQL